MTKGPEACRCHACTMMAAHAPTMSTPSQNGKKPLFGPSVPHPMPRRMASKTTTPPRSIRSEAVTRSALRIYFLSSPPFAISSRCCCSAPSSHFTYSGPVANAPLSAPLCR